jgi:PAS domain S-box-containing protein
MSDHPWRVSRRKTYLALLMPLLVAIVLTAGAISAITSLSRSYESAIEYAQLRDLTTRVVYLDSALTSTARAAVTSGSLEWRHRYASLENEFALAWPAMSAAVAKTNLNVHTNAANRAAARMTAIEHEALGLAATGKTERANALLSSIEYYRANETFAALAATTRQRVDDVIARDRRLARRRHLRLTIAAILLLPLFFVCGLYALRAFRSYVVARDKADASLRASEERFALIARATSDVMWDWKIADGTVWFNEAFHTQLGYPGQGVYPLSVWLDNIHAGDVEHVVKGLHDVIEGHAPAWSHEYRFRHADGTWGDFLDRGYVVRDADGTAIRVIGAMLNVTHRKTTEVALRSLNAELEEMSRRNELILNTAGDGIIGLDPEGAATFLNPAAVKMLGWPAETVRGVKLHELMHHTRADGTLHPVELCPTYRAVRTGEPAVVRDDIFWRADGTSFPVEYSSSAMRNDAGQIIGAVVTFRDTTARLEVQRMKDEFVSIVSHELRTPLTSIRGALGLLAGGLMAKSPEKGQRMLDIAVSNTDRLVRLINDILDIERIDSAHVILVKSRCAAATLIDDAIDVMRPMAEKAGVQLVRGVIDDNAIWADADRIVQTLTNLVSNAIKFSPAGSRVTLSATQERDGLVFRVVDRGRGIPADKLESVFDRFQQVDASDSREKGGSGLGLAICRSIVRQHGGELQVESVVGKGSTFRFSLPATRKDSADEHDSGAAKVLVCDDDPAIRDVLQTVLQQRGYHVRTVDGGDELLRAVTVFAPDVILLDVFMPFVNGWETLARLKNDEALAEIPVVLLSCLTEDETTSPFDLAGWVSKPVDEQSLLATLEHALGLAGRKPRLLIVEDDGDLARVIKESFERHGLETHHATSGREAIELAGALPPDLLILDLALPEIDGFGFVDWVRDQQHLCNVPLVVYSATDPSPAERQRLTLGPTQFLTKSRVPPQEFERRVVDLLDTMTQSRRGVSHVA